LPLYLKDSKEGKDMTMAKKKSTALAKIDDNDLPALPGIEKIDKGLLSEAVSELNRLYAAKSVETSCAIGEYILDRFFEGDMGIFNEWGGKHQTFGELIRMAQGENSPLHISASGLWYSVRILEQVKALPKEIAMALPVTHHRMLVPIKDAKTKLKLAKEAVSRSTPSRSFQDEVRRVREEERAGEERGFSSGRPALPPFAKGLKQLVKAVDTASSERITKGSFECYDAEQAKALLKEVGKALVKLQTVQSNIEKQIAALEAAE
jgi:hypothetical protein